MGEKCLRLVVPLYSGPPPAPADSPESEGPMNKPAVCTAPTTQDGPTRPAAYLLSCRYGPGVVVAGCV